MPSPARIAFERARLLEPRLETSLQRGPIKHGYDKQRALKHWHVPTVLHFTYAKLWRACSSLWRACSASATSATSSSATSSSATSSSAKPVLVESAELAEQIDALVPLVPAAAAPRLRRAALDFRSLADATHESHVASLVIASSWFTIGTFFIFLVGQIAVYSTGGATSPSAVDDPFTTNGAEDDAAQWAIAVAQAATIASNINQPIGALLATYNLGRKLRYQWECRAALDGKRAHLSCGASEEAVAKPLPEPSAERDTSARDTSARDTSEAAHKSGARESLSASLARLSSATSLAMLVQLTRIVASIGVAVSIPWNLASVFDGVDRSEPLYLAAAAVGLHAVAIGGRFVVEYSTLWSLPPTLGQDVLAAFDQELAAAYEALALTRLSTTSRRAHETDAWEYVARQFFRSHRFDTLLRANRFGSLLQHVQGRGDRPEATGQNS